MAALLARSSLAGKAEIPLHGLVTVKATVKSSFPAIYAQDARIIILGSLPGEASLAAQRYYAHPQNQFWRLMGSVLQEPLADLSYDTRLERLIAGKIALWDVVQTATREGSLDQAMRDISVNALQTFVHQLPALRLIAFNGQRAASIGTRALGACAVPIVTLPSSSPAYTVRFAIKAEKWHQLRTALT